MGDIVPGGIPSLAADAIPGDRSIDTIRNRTSGAVPTDLTALSDATEGDDETATDEAEGPPIDETATNADYADDRSDHEIEERADPDVREEPAEPGEMAVDEDLVEDLADGDTDTPSESDEETDSESEE